jgi:hypothetical protein
LTIANPFHTQYTDSTQVIPSGSTDERRRGLANSDDLSRFTAIVTRQALHMNVKMKKLVAGTPSRLFSVQPPPARMRA